MKKQLLIAAVTTALMAGTSLSFAQMSQEHGSSGGPAATSSGGAASEKMAPAGGAHAQTTPGSAMPDHGAAGAKSQSSADKSNAMQKSDTKGGQAQVPSNSSTSDRGTIGAKSQSSADKSDHMDKANDTKGAQAQDRNAGNQTNVNVSLSTEERTKIRRTVVSQSNAPRLNRNEINFSLNVGTVVPRSVHVAVLPTTVVEIHPAWRGYEYVLVGDELVILEPGSLRIVAIIPA